MAGKKDKTKNGNKNESEKQKAENVQDLRNNTPKIQIAAGIS
jgi:hypothetical protein